MENALHYLTEVRNYLIRCLLVSGSCFILLAIFANSIFELFALPLVKQLLGNPAHLVAISITSPILVPINSALTLALYITIPFWFYQGWCFIAPALYKHERIIIWKLFLLSSGLFYLGTLMAYFVVLPCMFHFILATAPISVSVQPDMSYYFSFVTRTIFVFGFMFELPIIMLLLIKMKLCSALQLTKARPYIIVGAFVIGMLLTPDIISQIFLALPLWGLYEVGLWIEKFV